MENIIIDTNAYADFVAGRRWGERIASAGRVCMPLPALAELRYGFLKGSQGTRNEAELARFLADPTVCVLSPDEPTAHHYARLRLQLVQQGTPIPVNDLWIAALAVRHGLWLCSADAHFDHLPQLLRARP